MPSSPSDAVHRYHDGTKHHFQRFARSLGYLDWASQPKPFRTYLGTREERLHPAPGAATGGYEPPPCAYADLYQVTGGGVPISAGALGDLLRHALGLSAWKQFGTARWSLRVNPSSGNLHPTEAYLVCGAAPGLGDGPAVYHYAADRHALERRCLFAEAAWVSACGGDPDVALLILSSIHWREAWKYGERAFRYCQHDLGHAIAAVRFAAAIVGWTACLLPGWSQRSVGSLAGLDRDEDFVEAEREEPACVLALAARRIPSSLWSERPDLVEAARRGRWWGRASQLSEDHVEWTIIDEVARATEDHGRDLPWRARADDTSLASRPREPGQSARGIVLQRRSAVAFDGRSSLDRDMFLSMLARSLPGQTPPWDALWWPPSIHFALFVHRVERLDPGLYLLPRTAEAAATLRTSIGREFRWERVADTVPLWCLARGDCRGLARRLSCDQDIAADGFFSLGMLAAFDESVDRWGASFYRQLYWEAGAIGQVLYLDAEAAGVRATGIGCFYDDPVHEVLGLSGHAFQSLYHFTVGSAVDDVRLTTAPGYEWELRRDGESDSMDESLRNSSQA